MIKPEFKQEVIEILKAAYEDFLVEMDATQPEINYNDSWGDAYTISWIIENKRRPYTSFQLFANSFLKERIENGKIKELATSELIIDTVNKWCGQVIPKESFFVDGSSQIANIFLAMDMKNIAEELY